MATITDNKYEFERKTFDARSGQEIVAPPIAAPLAPTPATPIARTIDQPQTTNASVYSQAETFLDSQFKQPESASQIAERKRKDSQALIDSINRNFDDEVQRKKTIGQERVNMDNAISVLTGNAGGTESVHSRKQVLDGNEKELQAVNTQRALRAGLKNLHRTISGVSA